MLAHARTAFFNHRKFCFTGCCGSGSLGSPTALQTMHIFFGIAAVIKAFSIAKRKFERVSIVRLEVIFLLCQPTLFFLLQQVDVKMG